MVGRSTVTGIALVEEAARNVSVEPYDDANVPEATGDGRTVKVVVAEDTDERGGPTDVLFWDMLTVLSNLYIIFMHKGRSLYSNKAVFQTPQLRRRSVVVSPSPS